MSRSGRNGNTVIGAPNLTDNIWLDGGSVKDIRETITKGRTNHMPAHLERLGEMKVRLLAAYVLSLSQPAQSSTPASANDSSAAAPLAGERMQIDESHRSRPWSGRTEAIGVSLWASFIAACFETALLFAYLDPLMLGFDERSGQSSIAFRSMVYALGFFMFWLFTLRLELLTAYMLRSGPRRAGRNSVAEATHMSVGEARAEAADEPLYAAHRKVYAREVQRPFRAAAPARDVRPARAFSTACRGCTGAAAKRCCSICRRASSSSSASLSFRRISICSPGS